MKIVLASLLLMITPIKIQEEVQLTDMSLYDDEFDYEIRYATPNNFIGEILYDCPKCLLQPKVAKAVWEANQYFCELGYKIKVYDCYRPLDVQKHMWSKVPRPTYVGNPYGKGSVHNRAAAVDITLVTLEGCYMNMGSDYDFFGRESHIDNYTLSSEILKNRKILIEGMRAHGFRTVRTEWWHYSFRNTYGFPILNEKLPCSN